MTPESPLPWTLEDAIVITDGRYVIDVGDCNMSLVDAAYVVHACNAYPKLIAVLKHCARGYQDEDAEQLLGELGED